MLTLELRMDSILVLLIERPLDTFQSGGSMFVRQLLTAGRTGSGRLCYDNVCQSIIMHVNFVWIIIIYTRV